MLELIPDVENLHGIFDIDGSLAKYVYWDQELLKDPARLNSVLSMLPQYVWVYQSRVMAKVKKAAFISGRKAPQIPLTERWIRKEFGLQKFDLVAVGYESREQYLRDKKKKIEEAASKFRRLGRVPIVFVDDDPDIVDWLVKTFTGPDDILISVDKAGKPTRL